MVQENNQRDRTTDLGVVRINNEAIATIASVAAMEIKGVHRMGRAIRRTICEALWNRIKSHGVKIHIKDSEVKLGVYIIVDYGVDIPRVADEVQENVKHAVEKMAGLILAEVDVIVEGVRPPEAGDNKPTRRG